MLAQPVALAPLHDCLLFQAQSTQFRLTESIQGGSGHLMCYAGGAAPRAVSESTLGAHEACSQSKNRHVW